MGTGTGKGDNRALEAAQQAISSPLLDNVSINGATGALVNITGGADLTLGEVTQISDTIHDAAGDDADVIFGAVVDAAMEGEIRVTVIATGFDRRDARDVGASRASGVIQFPQRQAAGMRASGQQAAAAAGGAGPSGMRRPSAPQVPPPGAAAAPAEPLSDMEIPTFIRRQMD
jgi:cell division protein FtsZ